MLRIVRADGNGLDWQPDIGAMLLLMAGDVDGATADGDDPVFDCDVEAAGLDLSGALLDRC